jgi:hypothetical protein
MFLLYFALAIFRGRTSLSNSQKTQLPHKLMLHQGNDALPIEIDQKYCSEPHRTPSSQYFDSDIAAQLTLPTRVIEVWLAHTEPLVQQGLAEAANTIATGHQYIREFESFQPTSQQPTDHNYTAHLPPHESATHSSTTTRPLSLHWRFFPVLSI